MKKNHQGESAAGIVFSSDRKKVLLVKRRDVPVWVLPGGGIERGETPERAAIRELEEETGYTVTLRRKVAEYTPLNSLARFTHLFECVISGGASILTAETQGIGFFFIDSLPPTPPPYSDWICDSARFLPEVLKKTIKNVTYKNLLKYFFMHPILVTRFLLARLGLPLNNK